MGWIGGEYMYGGNGACGGGDGGLGGGGDINKFNISSISIFKLLIVL